MLSKEGQEQGRPLVPEERLGAPWEEGDGQGWSTATGTFTEICMDLKKS